MTYSSVRFRKVFIQRYAPAVFCMACVGAAVLLAPEHYVALVFSGCLSVAVAGVFTLRGSVSSLIHSAHSKGRAMALLRTMAAASRQPFFFCCPVTADDGELVSLHVKFVNGAACRALAASRRELRGIALADCFTPASYACLLRQAREVLDDKNCRDLSVFLLRRSGEVEPYEVRLMQLADGIAMTTLHSREEEEANRRAEAADQFTQSVFENAPVSIIATDASGTIRAMNNAAEQLTLYRSYDLVGVHSVLALHDAAELSARAVERAQQTGERICAGFDSLTTGTESSHTGTEWTYIRRDGSRMWVSVTMSPLRDPSGAISGYLALAFDITERKHLSDAAQHMAHHDQLTGLPNRSLLESDIESSMQRMLQLQKTMAVYAVDVDHFKRMNDSLGHLGGDLVLKTVAQRLVASVRSSDVVVRVGGDEFVLILPDMAHAEDAAMRAQTVLDNISAPFFVGSREVRITASVGYCLFQGGDAKANDLLRRADLAMYAAKAAGRNSYVAFSSELEKETTDRLEMEEDLRHAIERGELALHYQPQVACLTGEVEGIEMLLRWSNSRRGNVPPDVFIPIAEQAGLMTGIGQWALRRACLDCADVQEKLGRRLRVAVNLSAREFQSGALPGVVAEALTTSHLRAADLELEITEQVLMSATPNLMKTLEDLRRLGVCLAIDDFGTGFSNFAYIMQYQVDRLKIDRSFISKTPHDAGAAAIVRTIVAMAHGLGMRVCAEGVETKEQFDFLARRRCDDIQGWLFARAVPISELVETIHRIESDPKCTSHSLQVSRRMEMLPLQSTTVN